MVFYRKYRPQTIAELDLSSVRERLTSILSAKELPHAFLFTGPKGLGKTSSARILAKAINCQTKKGLEPCNSCDICRSITAGSNLDVIEIDAASNRGIDEIRDLREKIKFAPAALSKKVYIIDEVHMLTTDAFNALLKTLEEPPSHAIFVLCTTEAEKVPPTISSRTFQIRFIKPSEEEILASLARIVKGEKIDIEKEVLERIYSLSEGSFRDAAKIFEDLYLASSGSKITSVILEKNYHTESIDIEAVKLIDSLAKKDIKKAFSVIEQLAIRGVDFKIFIEKLAEVLHSILLAGAGIEQKSELFPKLSTQEASMMLDLVNESYKNIKFAVLPQLPLELVIAEWCIGQGVQDLPVKSEPKAREEIKIEAEEVTTPQIKEEVNNDPPKSLTQKKEEKESVKDEPKTGSGDLFRKNGRQEDFFAALLSAVKVDNHSLAGILRGCKLMELGTDTVVFETKYKFHKDKLSEAKVRVILDKRASEILKEKVQVVVNLVEK